MQAKLQEQLSPNDAEVILGRLPERIRMALIERAAEISIQLKRWLRWRSRVFLIQRRWASQIVSPVAASSMS